MTDPFPIYKKYMIAEVNNELAGAGFNTLLAAGDINGDGFLDLVVSGSIGRMVWLENPGKLGTPWSCHLIDDAVYAQECGGIAIDLTGNGFADVINGNNPGDGVFWWENPGARSDKWIKREIIHTGHSQIHNIVSGVVTSDGRPSLVLLNQGGNNVIRLPIPEDPRVSPWPQAEIVHHFSSGEHNEGLAVADIDGDGLQEIVAATHWIKQTPHGWEAHQFAPSDYVATKVSVGDINGDGQMEIVLAEGDACMYGKPQGGKLSYFSRGSDHCSLWNEHVIDDFLQGPHSLAIGDLCGCGQADLLVGEMGDWKGTYGSPSPHIYIYANDGCGNFKRYEINVGAGTHDSVLIDTVARGILDIIGKPLYGEERWQVHMYTR